MTEGQKFARSVYGVVVALKNTLTLPTDKSLFEVFKYSAMLTVISLVSDLIGAYTFLTWQGCAVCTAMLVLLLWIERSENDALLRMYRNAEVLAKEGVRRAKKASTGIRMQGSAGSGSANKQKASERPASDGDSNNKGHSERRGNSGGNKGNAKPDRRNEKRNSRRTV